MTTELPEYHTLTLGDLRDPEWREELERAIESWLPNHVTSDGRVTSYDDLLDRLEGPFCVKGEWVNLSLGNDTSDPAYRALRRVAERVAREASG